MNLYSFSVLCFSFGVLLVGILALQKRRDEVSIRFFLFSIAVCGWGFLFSFWITQGYSEATALSLARISYIFHLFIPITWLHFALSFIEEKEPVKYFYATNYAIAFCLALFSQTPLIFKEMQPILELKYAPTPGPLLHIHVLTFFTLVPFGFYRLMRAYFASDGQKQEQIKYLMMGTAVGFLSGGTIYFVYYKIPFTLAFLSLMPLYPILTSIALIRYGLFDAQQIADAFQREKMAVIGTMAASLNHELRNPLYIAKGTVETQLDRFERGIPLAESKSQEVFRSVYSQLLRASDIMQRFSDFAKPFSARNDREYVALEKLTGEVKELVSNEFEIKKINFTHDLLGGISVYVNRRQMEEILFNLMINACHAIGDKGGDIALKAYQPNGKVIVEIADNGPGIPKENLRRIFEPFFSTKADKGTGLGLYITKQLVERNGGKIKVKSKVGQGSVFALEFERK